MKGNKQIDNYYESLEFIDLVCRQNIERARQQDRERAQRKEELKRIWKPVGRIWGAALILTIILAISDMYKSSSISEPSRTYTYQDYLQYVENQKEPVTRSLPLDYYRQPIELRAKDGRIYEINMTPEELLQYFDIDIDDLKEYLGDELR